MNQEQRYLGILKKYGLKNTPLRRQVFSILKSTHKPLTATQIIAGCPEAHEVSVYRTIDSFLRTKIIKQVPQGFKNRYELSDQFQSHHHHLNCERCGKSTAIEDQRFERLLTQIGLESRYTLTKHHLELYGICNDCRRGTKIA